MAITVDYSQTPWLITIPKSDLTLDIGVRYTIAVDKFWELLREYADGAESAPFPIIYSRIPATSSTPSITDVNELYYAAQFEDGAYAVDIIGGNTNFRVVEKKNQVSVGTNNTTGFINPTFLEFSTFGGGVHVDSDSIYSGAIYPIGTQTQKVNNLDDALTIAQVRGFNKFNIHGDIVFKTTTPLNDLIFEGQGQSLSNFNILSAANVYNSSFISASITGILDGESFLKHCIIEELQYVSGIVEDCILNPGTITLGGNELAQFLECESGVPGTGTPVIDCGGSGQSLAMRNYDGGVKLINKTGVESISIDLNAGQVKIDMDTVTNGTIVIRGVGKVINADTDSDLLTGLYGSLNLVNETVTSHVINDKLDLLIAENFSKVDFLALK